MCEGLLEMPDEELKEKIWSELGLNRERIKEAVEQLKDWLIQQPHLPNDLDDVRLERFLLRCKNRMETTKVTLDLYYTLKSISPEFMTGWDPQEDWFQKMCSVGYMYPIRRLTSEGDRIMIVGLSTTDATNVELIYFSKITFMMLEILARDDYCRSSIVVMDLRNLSLAHIPKLTLPALIRKFEIILMKGYKLRLKAIHLLNVSPFAEFLINMFKSVFKAKIAKRFHVHGSDFTELYKQVPKHLLPSDLGGDGTSIAQQHGLWKKKVEHNRDFLLNREGMKSNEKRRLEKLVESGDIFGIEGSFRKLNVD